MAEHSLKLKQLALVPVGSEVEVRFFRQPKRSGWDGSLKDVHGEPVEDRAVVRDVQSGVIFGIDWHFQLGLDSPQERDACANLVLTRSVRGRVVSCQVVSRDGSSDFQIETWLTIAEGASTPDDHSG